MSIIYNEVLGNKTYFVFEEICPIDGTDCSVYGVSIHKDEVSSTVHNLTCNKNHAIEFAELLIRNSAELCHLQDIAVDFVCDIDSYLTVA